MTQNKLWYLGLRMLDNEQCWRAILNKDRSQDGYFFFGVTTTGIYCCPSCPSRVPQRKNVRFYDTTVQAEYEGFRPCRKCHPLTTTQGTSNAERIRSICDYIRCNYNESDTLTLHGLSRKNHMSPFQLQRSFQSIIGVTPKQFLCACRLENFKKQLRLQKSVTTAIYQAGYSSSSRVYERSSSYLGMTPAEYRSGGKGVRIIYLSFESLKGRIMIGATERGWCFVQFAQSHKQLLEMLSDEFPAAATLQIQSPYPENLSLWLEEISEHIRKQQRYLNVQISDHFTTSQLRTWTYLQNSPHRFL